MVLYQKDDIESWADYTANNPAPKILFPPYPDEESRELALKYTAGYYNKILLNGGEVAIEATGNNPYVLSWNGATRTFMTKEEVLAYGSGSGRGITIGPIQPAAKKTDTVVVKQSIWTRVKNWFRNLFS